MIKRIPSNKYEAVGHKETSWLARWVYRHSKSAHVKANAAKGLVCIVIVIHNEGTDGGGLIFFSDPIKLFDTIRLKPDIGIKEKEILAFGVLNRAVAPRGKADVCPILNEKTVGPICNQFFKIPIRAVGGSIVGNDNLSLFEDGLAFERFQAAIDPPFAIVI